MPSLSAEERKRRNSIQKRADKAETEFMIGLALLSPLLLALCLITHRS